MKVTCVLDNKFSYSHQDIIFSFLFMGIKAWKHIIKKKEVITF